MASRWSVGAAATMWACATPEVVVEPELPGPLPEEPPLVTTAPAYTLPEVPGTPGLEVPEVDGFVELGRAAGLNHRQWTPEDDKHPCAGPRTQSGGFAVGDYDNDGDDDIFLPVLDRPSRLYRNLGDGRFLEVSRAAGLSRVGWPSSATWVDVDDDGDLDLAVGYLHGEWIRLYRNRGDATFEDITETSGLAPHAASQRVCPLVWGLAWADADVDGDLDLMMGTWGLPYGDDPRGVTTNVYWENIGGARFVDRTVDAGFGDQYGLWTFSPTWGDLDGDGLPDMGLTSDFLTNRLYRSVAPGRWTDDTAAARVGDVENGMGSVIEDLDDDGDLDWFVTSIFDGREEFKNYWGSTGNRLYLNDGSGRFVDESERAGVRDSGWGWGVTAFDLENDGDLDLAVTNGHGIDGSGGEYLTWPFHEDPSRLWVRSDGRYVDRAVELGFVHNGMGRGLVAFDLEGDGDQDLLMSEFAGRLLLWVNDLDDVGAWLRVRVRREGPNPFGVGATVWVQRTPEEEPRRRQIHANPTYLSQGPMEAHFGLGDHEGPVHAVWVVYPDGSTQRLEGVASNQLLTVR